MTKMSLLVEEQVSGDGGVVACPLLLRFIVIVGRGQHIVQIDKIGPTLPSPLVTDPIGVPDQGYLLLRFPNGCLQGILPQMPLSTG